MRTLSPHAHPRNHTRSSASPAKGLYLCSSSTPPAGRKHDVCGYLLPALPSQRVCANYTDMAMLYLGGYTLDTRKVSPGACVTSVLAPDEQAARFSEAPDRSREQSKRTTAKTGDSSPRGMSLSMRILNTGEQPRTPHAAFARQGHESESRRVHSRTCSFPGMYSSASALTSHCARPSERVH